MRVKLKSRAADSPTRGWAGLFTVSVLLACDYCGVKFSRRRSALKGCHEFCSRSCATSYRNKHRARAREVQ